METRSCNCFLFVPAYPIFDEFFPCHCENEENCHQVNGSCDSGCDGDNLMLDERTWEGDWYGPACQIGKQVSFVHNYVRHVHC